MATRSNPRGTTLDRLLPFLLAGGGYYAAREGLFGEDVKRQVRVFEARLSGGASGAINPSLPPAGAVIGGAVAPCNAPGFIQGVQYVDARPDGRYGCVVGGQVRGVFNTLAEAESCYRRAFGCAG